jgi:hypothetical protein
MRRKPSRVTALTRRQVVTDREWYGSVCYNEYHRVIRLDHCLGSPLELSPDGSFTCIILHRTVGEQDFSERQSRLLRLFHAELGRLIGPVLITPSDRSAQPGFGPGSGGVQCLLQGDAEKQVAARMRLSTATVHQYVSALYRHYQVTSRGELLSRVLRRMPLAFMVTPRFRTEAAPEAVRRAPHDVGHLKSLATPAKQVGRIRHRPL